jgi:hypothetical protein
MIVGDASPEDSQGKVKTVDQGVNGFKTLRARLSTRNR